MEVSLTLGQGALIDDCDVDAVSHCKWQARPRRDGKGWYAVSSSGIRMHRMLMSPPDELVVDHIDGDGLNNRRTNLRIGTQSQNCVNRKTTPGPHLRGVRPKLNKWKAYIKYQGKQHHLGYFNTQEEAHQVYLAAASRLHGDWMPLPPPPEQNK